MLGLTRYLAFAAFGFLSVCAEAQQTISIGYEKPTITNEMPLSLRSPSHNEMPSVKAGLQVEKFAALSRHTRGLAVRENGDLLTLDQNRGRITVLTDRSKDGRMDMRKTLPLQFNNPVALAVHEDVIYVADQDAVWEISDGTQKVLASLKNANALTEHRPIMIAPDTQYLYLGLSQNNGQSRVVAIDRFSGQAQSVAAGEGEITSFAQVKGTALWLGLDNELVPVQGEIYDRSLGITLPDHVSVEQVYLPTSDSMIAPGVSSLAGKFLVALDQDNYGAAKEFKGRRIIAFKSAFGRPDGQPVSVMEGFLANHGRSAWGEPGAMAWDERGLFVADRQNGIIWRLSQLKPKIRIVEKPKKDIKFYKSDEIKKPKAKWGSSIEQASSIISGSTLTSSWEESKLIPKETLMQKLRNEEKKTSDDKE